MNTTGLLERYGRHVLSRIYKSKNSFIGFNDIGGWLEEDGGNADDTARMADLLMKSGFVEFERSVVDTMLRNETTIEGLRFLDETPHETIRIEGLTELRVAGEALAGQLAAIQSTIAELDNSSTREKLFQAVSTASALASAVVTGLGAVG